MKAVEPFSVERGGSDDLECSSPSAGAVVPLNALDRLEVVVRERAFKIPALTRPVFPLNGGDPELGLDRHPGRRVELKLHEPPWHGIIKQCQHEVHLARSGNDVEERFVQ